MTLPLFWESGFAMLKLRMFEHGLKTQFSIYATLTPNLRVLGVLLLLTVISTLASCAWQGLVSGDQQDRLRHGGC